MKNVQIFTREQIAKICKVAPRTVGKWFDSDKLRGYRIPGTQDIRVPREYLIRFLKEWGLPLDGLEEEDEETQIKSHPLVPVTLTVHPNSIVFLYNEDEWTCVRAKNFQGVTGKARVLEAAYDDLVNKERRTE